MAATPPANNTLGKDETTNIPIGQQQLYTLNESGGLSASGPGSPLFNYDFMLAVSRGLIPGHAIFDKFGRNPAISAASTPEDIWNGGDIYTGFPTGAAETIDVFSDNAEDGAGTLTGLLTIRLFGQLNGVEQTEDVTLQGATKVTTTKTWTRMQRMRGLTAGSTGSNVGTITAQHTTTTANVFAQMPPETNRTQIAAFTVPANKTLYLKLWDPRIVLPTGGTAAGTMAIMQREQGGLFEQTHSTDLTSNGPAPLPVDSAIVFPAFADVVARVLSTSANGVSSTAQFFGVLVDDV